MSDDAAPKRTDIEQQLDRILASTAFATRPKLQALISRLVKDTLNGTVGGENYETTLAREVFETTKDFKRLFDSVVRQGMVNLRKCRDAYYRADGYSDEVDICFPKRVGFRATFSYRRRNNARASFDRIVNDFGYAFPDTTQCKKIVAEMESSLAVHQDYAPGYAILAEALLACALCDDNDTFPLPEALLRAEKAAATGMTLHRDLWRMHVVQGAIHCCRFAWAKAEMAFKTALRLAPDDTQSHFWYMVFLVAVGHTEQAQQCIARRTNVAGIRLTRYAGALVLYVMRDFYGAYDAIIRASGGSRWSRALDESHERGISRIDFGREWPAAALVACVCLALNHTGASSRYAFDVAIHFDSKVITGLFDVAQAAEVRLHGPTTDAPWISIPEPTPLSRALTKMAEGLHGDAIAELERACEDGHPLMVWLHLWPILDPLRDDPRFKKLIKRMKLPSGALGQRQG